MRPHLQELTAEEVELAELQILLARRRDLVIDQTRTINRLRDALLSSFPALERALDLNLRGPLTLLSQLPKGTVATTNDFGIVGIGGPAGTIQTNAQVQAFVGNPNNLTNDGSGGSVNGVDIISGSNYTSRTQT
jgi:hypothetical protein